MSVGKLSTASNQQVFNSLVVLFRDAGERRLEQLTEIYAGALLRRGVKLSIERSLSRDTRETPRK